MTITFRTLESSEESLRADFVESEEGLWPLQAWYASIRDKPIEELSIGDLSIAIRQRINLGYVMPFAFKSLDLNPLAGDQVDGELILSMKSLPTSYWLNHQDEVAEFLRLAQRGYEEALNQGVGSAGYEDLRIDASDLLGIQAEKHAPLNPTVPKIGQGQVIGSELRLVLRLDEMNRLADLVADSAQRRSEFDVRFGDILIKFAHGSSTGTASFTAVDKVIFRSNKRDLHRLSDALRETASHYLHPQLLRMVPRYLVSSPEITDIIFGDPQAYPHDMAIQ